MSKDDFDHLTIMRVRTGPSQGDSTERQMLDAINDTGGFRTRIMIHPDGSQTRMKTKCGMPEFITDEVVQDEETCTLKLDNGVVDLLSASFLGTIAGDQDDGILYRTNYVSQHIAASEAETIAGPTDGAIHPPEAIGASPDDALAAASFKYLGDYPFGTSAYDKKRKSVLCPPSIFTGKMRQYMQALYGRHDQAEILRLPDATPLDGPCIYFDSTKTFGDESDPMGAAVKFDTNCGIYTDPVTCKHYLISVAGEVTKIYRMLATTCAEKLRKKLKDVAVPLGTKVRIETYILSQSRPDTNPDQIVTLESPNLPHFQMGYGWHFNYNGSACDMVVTEYVYPGENVSTHYRLNFTFFAESGYWTLTPVVVEGPTTWKNYRHQHVIAYPHWSYTGLQKFGVNSSVQPHGDAPFYAFYVRSSFDDLSTGGLSLAMGSELRVSRYSAVESVVPRGADRTPAYMNPGTLYVFGSDAADYRTWGQHYRNTYTIVCGDASVSVKDEVFTKNCAVHGSATADWTWGDTGGFYTGTSEAPAYYSVPTGQGVPENCTYGTIYDYWEGTVTVCAQVEGQSNAGPYEQATGYVDRANLLGYSMLNTPSSTWTDEAFTSAENYSAKLIVTVPFDDAEALYMLAAQEHSALETGHARAMSGGSFFRSHAVRPYFNGPWTIIAADARLGAWGAGAYSEGAVTFADRVASYAPQNTYYMVGNYGTKPSVSVPTPAAFYDPTDEIVPVVVSHKSSAVGVAAHSDDFGIDEGMTTVDLDGKPFTFVGWA